MFYGPMLGRISPDMAILLATVGCALILLELNRPGTILPGAVGLLLLLVGLRVVLAQQHGLFAALLMTTAAAVLMLPLRRSVPAVVSVAGTAALVAAFWLVTNHAGSMLLHSAISLACGVMLGSAAFRLTRIAHRARVSKGLD